MSVKRRLLTALLVLFGLMLSRTPIHSAGLAAGKREVITLANVSRVRPLSLLGRGEVRHLTWSPDGKTFLVSSSRGVWLYNPNSLSQPPRLLDSRSVLRAVFNSDGTKLATYDRFGPVSVWDSHTFKRLEVIPIPDQNEGPNFGEVYNVTFNPSGALLITSDYQSNHGFHTWDAHTQKVLVDAKDFKGYDISDIEVSPDGSLLAVAQGSGSSDSNVQLWSLITGERLSILDGQFSSTVNNLAFNPAGNLMATANGIAPSEGNPCPCAGNVVALWNTKTNRKVSVLGGHRSYVIQVAFSPGGGTLASASGDDTVRLWDIRTGTFRLITNDEGIASVGALAFNPQGSILAVATNGGHVSFWNLSTATKQAEIDGFSNNNQIYILLRGPETGCCVAFSADSARIALGQLNGLVQVWDTATGNSVRILHGHKDAVAGIAFSPDGRTIISQARDDGLRFCPLGTDAPQCKMDSQHAQNYFGIFPSPNGKYIIFYGGNDTPKLELYSVDPFTKVREFDNVVFAFSSDSALLAVDSSNSIEIWDIKANQKIQDLSYMSHEGADQLAFDPSGKQLISVSAENGDVVIRDVESGQVTKHFNLNAGRKNNDKPFIVSALNAARTRMASLNEKWVHMWNLQTGSLIFTIDTRLYIPEMMFSPNDELFAAEVDGHLSLLNPDTGAELAQLRIPGESERLFINDFAFSPDGTLIAIVGADDAITLYGVAPVEF